MARDGCQLSFFEFTLLVETSAFLRPFRTPPALHNTTQEGQAAELTNVAGCVTFRVAT